MICIDAENLRDGLYNIKDGKIFKYKAKGGTVRAYKLENRPQGEWIEVEEDWRHQIEFWKCSECDFAVSSMYNYCPNCGARMKGADDE